MAGLTSLRKNTNVPVDVTSFVGRSRELREIRDLLSHTRLLTLTGVGGVGKTRLAKAAIANLYRSFDDGARFVDLSEVPIEGFVEQFIRDATPGVRDANTLVGQLAGANVLLVLDDCEHLVEPVGAIVADVLAWCPMVRILTTTRLPLGIAGEHVLQVSPLGVEPSTRGQVTDSAMLFTDRARAVTGREFTVTDAAAIDELCRRLEGLPLAIELAAIKTRIMTVPEISAGLDDRFGLLRGGPRDAPQRYRSLDAMLRWSWDHCDADERRLWAQFSVFAGSVSMDAVGRICELADPASTSDVVDRLVQRSLLVCEDSQWGIRFRMLDTIREFGQRAGADVVGPSDALRTRHLRYYASMVSTLQQNWFGGEQQRSSHLVQANIANIRRAFDYAVEHEDRTDLAEELFSDLWMYWVGCGRLAEGRAWATKLSPRVRVLGCAASWTYGWILLLSGDTDGARRHLSACAADADRRRSSDRDRCLSVGLMAACSAIEGDDAGAIGAYDHAIDLAREAGDAMCLALMLQNQAEVSCLVGDFDRAEANCEVAENVCIEYGDQWCRSHVLWVRSLIAFRRGDAVAARRHGAEALRLKTATEDQLGLALIAETLAWSLAQLGDHAMSATLLGATESYWTATGCPLMGLAPLNDDHGRCLADLTEALGTEELRRRLIYGAAQDITRVPLLVDVTDGDVEVPNRKRPVVDHRADHAGSVDSVRLSALTERQHEIARLIARGMTNKEIAAALVIGRRTVDTHVGHILTRLGVSRRSEIATLVASTPGPGGPPPPGYGRASSGR